jgi:hypothetical protein
LSFKSSKELQEEKRRKEVRRGRCLPRRIEMKKKKKKNVLAAFQDGMAIRLEGSQSLELNNLLSG